MREGYDVMQVCLNGHMITDTAMRDPYRQKPNCPECGARTITECLKCSAPIQGAPLGAFSFQKRPVPPFCWSCGAEYPWREAAIAKRIEKLRLLISDQVADEGLLSW